MFCLLNSEKYIFVLVELLIIMENIVLMQGFFVMETLCFRLKPLSTDVL